MSLLMDAMKTAELAKEQGSNVRSAASFRPPAPNDSANREAIRNAFAVKQTPAVGNRFAWVVGSMTLLAVVGIGIYFWLQLQPVPSLVAKAPSAPPAAASLPSVLPSPLPQIAPPAPATTTPPHATSPATVAAASTEIERKPAAKGPKPVRTPASAPIAPQATVPVRILGSASPANPIAVEGWEAYQAGNLAAARDAYERLLAGEPWNKDAMHGIAAIALREGRTADAEAAYRRVLAADPRDALAQAGVAGLHARSETEDPAAAEDRLKSLLAGQPNSPALHFALGNLYARQSRWTEAQEAYFAASAGDAGNPDVLFNLAVSLDQLRQPGLAADFYRQALAAAERRPAGFDRAAAADRLRKLQP